MEYKIFYTEESERDIDNIYNYLAFSLFAPDAARNQVNDIMRSIDALEAFPLRNKIYPGEPWKTLGLRVLKVNNYLVFYKVVAKEKMVIVIRIMYGRRNIDLVLSNR